MLALTSATDVAFTMAGLMQAVLAIVWLLGAWLIVDTRRAALCWAAYAGLSTISFVLLTSALHAAAPSPAEIVRATGNLAGVIAIIALRAGIRYFVGKPVGWRGQSGVLAVVLVAAWIGLSPERGSVRVVLTSAMLALLTLAIARDLVAHAREELHHRWPIALGVPVLLAAAGFAFRAGRALLHPDSVSAQMTRDSVLNVGSALGYVAIALAFHATLMALVVARLTAQLRHRSRHDGLTGLLDRRAIEEALETQMQRSRRTGEAFSVLMFDLDHFKSINDRHGHAAGDNVLEHVAALLGESFREVDPVGRIGGEEFLALMPGATLDAAGPVAERVRERLSARPLLLDAVSVHLSVSIGVAQWNPPDEDVSGLLRRADAALYRAKAQGRDRVVAAVAESQLLAATPAL
jgi:diguanylate cyclase (GGDEF)-like protein